MIHGTLDILVVTCHQETPDNGQGYLNDATQSSVC